MSVLLLIDGRDPAFSQASAERPNSSRSHSGWVERSLRVGEAGHEPILVDDRARDLAVPHDLARRVLGDNVEAQVPPLAVYDGRGDAHFFPDRTGSSVLEGDPGADRRAPSR